MAIVGTETSSFDQPSKSTALFRTILGPRTAANSAMIPLIDIGEVIDMVSHLTRS